mgnify:CR=1 FL=1
MQAPTLLLVGDADIVRPEHTVEMFRLLGGGVNGDVAGLSRSRLAVLPGTTHVGVLRPSRLARLDDPRLPRRGTLTIRADTVRFVFVDVFAPSPLTGSPVAVVPDADDLDLTTLRAIAREFSQSETTFLLRPTAAEADWRLRSFTPIGAEVFGAGHKRSRCLVVAGSRRTGARRPSRYIQQIGDDLLDVVVHRTPGRPDVVSMDQSPPVFGNTVDDPAELRGRVRPAGARPRR